jgi:hypothetical protein
VTQDILSRNHAIAEDEAHQHALYACQYAKQLYAVLAYVKKGPDILSLLNEGVGDKALPLTRGDNDEGLFALFRKTEDSQALVSIPTFERWSEKEREKFDRIQWWMTAPVFEEKVHYELDEKTILPFVKFKGEAKLMQGGYSEVYPVRIHPAHHDFWKAGLEVNKLVYIKVNPLTEDRWTSPWSQSRNYCLRTIPNLKRKGLFLSL